jgi:hypothetical protein
MPFWVWNVSHFFDGFIPSFFPFSIAHSWSVGSEVKGLRSEGPEVMLLLKGGWRGRG